MVDWQSRSAADLQKLSLKPTITLKKGTKSYHLITQYKFNKGGQYILCRFFKLKL